MNNLKNFALIVLVLFATLAAIAAIPNAYHVVKDVMVAPTTDADGNGGYFAAQMSVRETLAKGEHLTLRLKTPSAAYTSTTFWFDFMAEGGDLWDLPKAERNQRVYNVLSKVHVVGTDLANSNAIHRAMERGAGLWLTMAQREPLADEDKN